MDQENLRNKRLEELQEHLKRQQELQRQISIIESIAKQVMTKEAITRYGNLKSAHPEKAIQAITIIAQAVQSGQMKEKITDEQLKRILLQLQKPRKETKIKRA